MLPIEPVAVLHQALRPPLIGGVAKPKKPGGYRDSSADIAFGLAERGIRVVTPVERPNPDHDDDWSFPDTAAGIDQAVTLGARTLWANTVLYSTHPLAEVRLRLVAQRPADVERYDDKVTTNGLLERRGCPVPKSLVVEGAGVSDGDWVERLRRALHAREMEFPLVAKPIRGRGSEGVSKVESLAELRSAVETLCAARSRHDGVEIPRYGDAVLVEEFLPGRELTVTVMPPGSYSIAGSEVVRDSHWALGPVERFSHRDGIAPYSGVVAVAANSRLLDAEELADESVRRNQRHCESAARAIDARAPIRIDCREDRDGAIKLFDLNMKPNMTGAGRPGRDDQNGLSSIAAHTVGWNYRDLLVNMLRQAWTAEPTPQDRR